MDIRRAGFILFAAVLVLAGCREGKSAKAVLPENHPVPAVPMQTVARIHWMGINWLARETNAVSFMSLWNLPESRKLELQTLDKSSLAPWRLLHRKLDTNAAARFRPLLDDMVADESCLEVRRATNQPMQLVFAIRLDDQRAALWQTNLAVVLESLTGIHPVPASNRQYGWSLKKHHAPDFLELTRAGDWTILSATEDNDSWITEVKTRIQQGQTPILTDNSNDWLQADFDPSQFTAFFSPSTRATGEKGRGGVGSKGIPAFNSQLSTLNHLHLAVTGDGTNVLTRGTADFSRPLNLPLPPWNIPTNLIDQHLSSFTLVRGFQPWLASSQIWTNLQIGPPPDQVCCWAVQGLGMLSYFTAPVTDASNKVSKVTAWVVQNQFHWFPTNDLAKFEKSATNGLEWKGLPYMTPFLQSINIGNENYIYGGGFLNTVASPLSLETLGTTLETTNLVYHDWEITGPRIEQWLYMSQFARLITHKAQLPTDSAALLWIKALTAKPTVSATDITLTAPNQLSFSRKSGIGFTGIELNLLADWLESPQFPIGLHTFLAPPPPQP